MLTAASRQPWCPCFRKPTSCSPSAPCLRIPAVSFLLNSCTFGFSESFTFQRSGWSREERGCIAHGLYAQNRGPKSSKAWSCARAWKHRRKKVFVFNSCPCLQVGSLVAPAYRLIGLSPRLPGFVGKGGCCSRGRGATTATRWPQSVTVDILFLLVSQALHRVQQANRACGESSAQGWACLCRTIYIASCLRLWGKGPRQWMSLLKRATSQGFRVLTERKEYSTKEAQHWPEANGSDCGAQGVSCIGNLHLARAPGT